jgi:Cdc6-like AAA superfamily ATPase
MASFLTENAIQSVREDRLHRRLLAERVADALVDRDTGYATGVVVGLTGPWGSGKSSFLNLVAEWVADNHAHVVIVPFNPWLVTSQDGLIATFLADVGKELSAAGTRSGKAERRAKLTDVARSLLDYGKMLAPAGNLIHLGAGTAAGAGLEAAKKALGDQITLRGARKRLADQLTDTNTHVLVLIDEIDRLTDAEVALIAQLVRAVLDFGNISYLLAYDAERVATALGGGDMARGRAFMEKIVQLQIPLPPASHQTLRRLIAACLNDMKIDVGRDSARLEELLRVLVPGSIDTMRDAKRLLGAFQILEPMHRLEVNAADLLAWAAILTKYPAVERALNAQRADLAGDEATLFGEKLLDRMLAPTQEWRISVPLELVPMPENERNYVPEGVRIARTIVKESVRQDALMALLSFVFNRNRSSIPSDSLVFFMPFSKVITGGVLIDVSGRAQSAPHPRHRDVAGEVNDKPATALTAALQAAERRGALAEYLAALAALGSRALSAPAKDAWAGFDAFCEQMPQVGGPSRETPNRMVAKFLSGPWLGDLGAFSDFLGDPAAVIANWIEAGHTSLPGHILELHLSPRRDKYRKLALIDEETAYVLIEKIAAHCRIALRDQTLIQRIPDMACLRAVRLNAASGWSEVDFRSVRENLEDDAALDRFVWLCHADGVPEDTIAASFVDKASEFRRRLLQRLEAGATAISEPLHAAYVRAVEQAEFRVRFLAEPGDPDRLP